MLPRQTSQVAPTGARPRSGPRGDHPVRTRRGSGSQPPIRPSHQALRCPARGLMLRGCDRGLTWGNGQVSRANCSLSQANGRAHGRHVLSRAPKPLRLQQTRVGGVDTSEDSSTGLLEPVMPAPYLPTRPVPPGAWLPAGPATPRCPGTSGTRSLTCPGRKAADYPPSAGCAIPPGHPTCPATAPCTRPASPAAAPGLQAGR